VKIKDITDTVGETVEDIMQRMGSDKYPAGSTFIALLHRSSFAGAAAR
jgi:hypothetical protein